jgi:hypothetical protein
MEIKENNEGQILNFDRMVSQYSSENRRGASKYKLAFYYDKLISPFPTFLGTLRDDLVFEDCTGFDFIS